jgi:hypothetical protein
MLVTQSGGNNCNICECELTKENKVKGKVRCLPCNKKLNQEYCIKIKEENKKMRKKEKKDVKPDDH